VEGVVHTGESGFDRKRFGLALGRIGFGSERFVFIEADDDPSGAGRARRLLLRKTGCYREEK
jgi:hypothetical protein